MINKLEEFVLLGVVLGRNGNSIEVLATSDKREELRKIWTYFGNISSGFEEDLSQEALRRNVAYFRKLSQLQNVNYRKIFSPKKNNECSGRYFKARIIGIAKMVSRDKYGG